MTANDIRNIALLGHGGSGKTSLAEQMLPGFRCWRPKQYLRIRR